MLSLSLTRYPMLISIYLVWWAPGSAGQWIYQVMDHFFRVTPRKRQKNLDHLPRDRGQLLHWPCLVYYFTHPHWWYDCAPRCIDMGKNYLRRKMLSKINLKNPKILRNQNLSLLHFLFPFLLVKSCLRTCWWLPCATNVKNFAPRPLINCLSYIHTFGQILSAIVKILEIPFGEKVIN